MEPHNATGPSSLDDTIPLEETVRFRKIPRRRQQLPPASPDSARIIPVNDRAKQVFRDIVQIQDTDPNWGPKVEDISFRVQKDGQS